MKKIILRSVIVAVMIANFTSCKKTNESGCWECKDASGNSLQEYCANNEDEAFNQAKGGSFNGVIITTKTQFLQACPKK